MQNGGDAFIAIFVGLIIAPWVIALTFDGLGWLKRGIEKETQAARTATATAQKERETKLNRERAQSRYAIDYAEYLPKWQAWHEADKAYYAANTAYEVWQVKFRAAWEAYRQQGVKAAELFEIIHENVEKRGRLELELNDPEHLTALFREAISVAARVHPELGLLRMVRRFVGSQPPPSPHSAYNPLTFEEHEQLGENGQGPKFYQVHPSVGFNLPELAYLLDDARLEAVRDLLPPIPPLASEGRESRTAPKRPMRPTPPESLLFYGQNDFIKEFSPPVPPDKVVWS